MLCSIHLLCLYSNLSLIEYSLDLCNKIQDRYFQYLYNICESCLNIHGLLLLNHVHLLVLKNQWF